MVVEEDRNGSKWVIIPAYEPTSALRDLVTALRTTDEGTQPFRLLVIDDGSRGEKAQEILREIGNEKNCNVLHLHNNCGKGAALKEGLQYVARHDDGDGIVVTADADGQHRPKDIVRVANKAAYVRRPVLGVRAFGEHVPFRNWIGNLLTYRLFKLATGVAVSDTQTGLRGYPVSEVSSLTSSSRNGYDYEFECLFDLAHRWGDSLAECPIETVYDRGENQSHFNPLKDSITIYSIFLRHVSVSVFAALSDMATFALLTLFGIAVLPALIVSRLISAPIYIFGMIKGVFENGKRTRISDVAAAVVKLLLLMTIHVAVLNAMISWLSGYLGVHPIAGMVVSAGALYIATYMVQRFTIFKPQEV